LNANFVSTALPHSPQNVNTHGGLIVIASAGKESKYIAMLDEAMHFDWLPFDDWWNQTVFIDDQKRILSRKQLVLTAANQDGGAHVDPSLDETYANLSRNNSLKWVAVENGNEYSIPKPERAAIRQITHEVLRTLKPDYRMKPQYEADIIIGGAMIVKGSKAPEVPRPKKIERNEQCPCGSGKKYKKCHGKP